MNTNRIEHNPIDSLIAFWRKGINKPILFSILFWTWVICTTFWIETASVHTIQQDIPNQNYSRISFSNLHFVQDNSEGAQLTLTAPSAAFESDTQEMRIDNPTIQWSDSVSGNVCDASGSQGVFYSQQMDSPLPSVFRYLVLSGTATIQGRNSRVDSQAVIFDNERRLFVIPGTFDMQKGSVKFNYKQMYYDPIKDKILPLGGLTDENSELKRLIQTIGTTNP